VEPFGRGGSAERAVGAVVVVVVAEGVELALQFGQGAGARLFG
jgi:hypothetical protein